MSESNVVIVGAGAMGGVFGALLAETGTSTTLVDANRQLVDAINERGITLVGPDGERTIRVPATTTPASLGAPDAVLFFVKCHHTEAAVEAARPMMVDGTRAVTLQNGWGNADVLARAYGKERVVVGVTYTSATTAERAIIRTSGPARTVLGPLAGDESVSDPVVRTLEGAGFPVEHTTDVLTEVWKKLILNAATLPTAALAGLTAGELATEEHMRWLVDAAAAEAVAVGNALGFSIELEERLDSIHSVLERVGSGKGSMVQDVEAGRPTEIDVISGAVLQKAEERGLETPITRSLYALVTGLERSRGQR